LKSKETRSRKTALATNTRVRRISYGRCKQRKSVPSDTREVTYIGSPPAKHVGLLLAHGSDPAAEEMAHPISSHVSLATALLLRYSSNVRSTNTNVLTLHLVLGLRLERDGGAADTDSLHFPKIWQYFGWSVSARQQCSESRRAVAELRHTCRWLFDSLTLLTNHRGFLFSTIRPHDAVTPWRTEVWPGDTGRYSG
jgi:hypothetical protein